MLHHRVANNQLRVGCKWQKFKLKRPAIQEQGFVLLTKQRNELIHDTDARANKFVLSFAAKFGQLSSFDTQIKSLGQCVGGRNFKRSGGTQTGPNWHVTLDTKASAT